MSDGVGTRRRRLTAAAGDFLAAESGEGMVGFLLLLIATLVLVSMMLTAFGQDAAGRFFDVAKGFGSRGGL